MIELINVYSNLYSGDARQTFGVGKMAFLQEQNWHSGVGGSMLYDLYRYIHTSYQPNERTL